MRSWRRRLEWWKLSVLVVCSSGPTVELGVPVVYKLDDMNECPAAVNC
jgi:hypothetical protein